MDKSKKFKCGNCKQLFVGKPTMLKNGPTCPSCVEKMHAAAAWMRLIYKTLGIKGGNAKFNCQNWLNSEYLKKEDGMPKKEIPGTKEEMLKDLLPRIDNVRRRDPEFAALLSKSFIDGIKTKGTRRGKTMAKTIEAETNSIPATKPEATVEQNRSSSADIGELIKEKIAEVLTEREQQFIQTSRISPPQQNNSTASIQTGRKITKAQVHYLQTSNRKHLASIEKQMEEDREQLAQVKSLLEHGGEMIECGKKLTNLLARRHSQMEKELQIIAEKTK